MNSIQKEVGDLLRRRGLTLGLVESATGGIISGMITAVAGSSDYYQGSVTSYSNRIKRGLVGVKEETLAENGVVSPRVAEEMAWGGRRVLGVDICLSDTGIAGPGGATAGKPVGLFYIGLAHEGGTFSRRCEFRGSRQQNRQAAAEAVLSWLKEYLLSLEQG